MLFIPLPLSQTVTPSRTLSPSSVTYFMDGPMMHLCITRCTYWTPLMACNAESMRSIFIRGSYCVRTLDKSLEHNCFAIL